METINKILKRSFDIFFSIIGIVLLSPLFVITSIIIKLSSEGPILFKQIRIGKDKREFNILKFRTMIVNAESYGKQITVGKDKRITKIGKVLRKYKLDELPQLFNVFFGDMSLVGPRPEVPYYVNMYTNEQTRVLNVRPGITDLASIRYSDENEVLGTVDDAEKYYINVIMPDKLELNLKYIEKQNIFYDFYIIVKTILKIF